MEIWKGVKTEATTRRRFCLSLVFAFVDALLCAATPVLTVWALYTVMRPESPNALWIALGAVAAMMLRFPVLSVQLTKSWEAAFEIGVRLRERLLAHMRQLPLGVVRAQSSARLTGLFNDDIKWIEAFTGGGLGMAIGAICCPLLLLVSLFFLDVTSALIITAGVVVGLPLLRLFASVLKTGFEQRSANIDALSNRIGEHFAGMAVLRSFNAVGTADADFKHDMDRLRRAYRHSAFTVTPFSVASLFVMESGLAVCAFIGALGVSNGHLAPQTLIFVLFIGLSLYNPLLLFLGGAGHYRLARIATDNINRFLKLEPMATASGAQEPVTGHRICFDDISFHYDGKTENALQNVSFQAEPGQLTAIVGPSGAGKSTIFNLIARFWDPQAGVIRLGNRDITTLAAQELSELISVVTQETVLINDTLRRNLDLGRPGMEERKLPDAVDQARCADFINRLPDGLDSQAGQDGVRLSGGEKQRLTIARALLKDAPIILLDEATAAVDPSNAKLIQDAVASLTKDRTVIVIAHRLSSVIDADKIIVMDKGRIVAQGTHKTLLEQNPLYGTLWEDHRTTQRWSLAGESKD